MGVEIKIRRIVKSYVRGLMSWTVNLECGHKIVMELKDLQKEAFLDQRECKECEDKFTREIEMWTEPSAND